MPQYVQIHVCLKSSLDRIELETRNQSEICMTLCVFFCLFSGGQAKTLMFVQINPDVESYAETISTLKFAERVSGVELGAARSNREGKDIKELLEQVGLIYVFLFFLLFFACGEREWRAGHVSLQIYYLIMNDYCSSISIKC